MNTVNISSLLLDMSPNYIHIVDMDTYEIYFLNNALLELHGNPPEEVWKNTPCYKLLQNLDEPCEFCTNDKLREDDFYEWKHYNKKHDVWFAIKNRKATVDGKNLRLEYAWEATEIFEKEKQLHSNLEEEQVLIACIGLLHSANSLESSLKKLLDLILAFYQADRTYIIDIDNKNNFARTSLESYVAGKQPHLDKLQNISLKYLKIFFDSFRKENICYIDHLDDDVNIAKYPRSHKLLKGLNVSSLLIVPLVVDDIIVGLLGIDNPKNHIDAKALLKQVSYFVSDFKEKEILFDKLHSLSYTDSLTPLHNMHKYVEDLTRYEKYPPSSLGVAYVDINGLKKVNDTIGHEAGNKLIISLGKILHTLFTCFAYRTGGDEFIILMPECRESEFVNKIEKLREMVHDDKDLFVAIGSSWSDNPENTIKSQIQATDAAMYNDKKQFYASKNFDRRQNR